MIKLLLITLLLLDSVLREVHSGAWDELSRGIARRFENLRRCFGLILTSLGNGVLDK